jgi:hypothetical protein
MAVPDTLYSNDSVNTAQGGETNPTDLTDTTPVFSAKVYPEAGKSITHVRIQVNTAANFAGTMMWDSGLVELDTPISSSGDRTEDIEYGEE